MNKLTTHLCDLLSIDKSTVPTHTRFLGKMFSTEEGEGAEPQPFHYEPGQAATLPVVRATAYIDVWLIKVIKPAPIPDKLPENPLDMPKAEIGPVEPFVLKGTDGKVLLDSAAEWAKGERHFYCFSIPLNRRQYEVAKVLQDEDFTSRKA